MDLMRLYTIIDLIGKNSPAGSNVCIKNISHCSIFAGC